MRNRLLTYLLGIVAFLSLNGCVGALFPKDSEDGTGSGNIIINISSKPEVKAPLAAPDDDVINHLIVWLVKDGKVIKKSVLTPGAQTASVEFNEVQRGRHDIYIVANRSGLASSYEEGATGISGITSQALDEIADKASPSYTAANGVPAALKTYVDVAPGDNVVSAELIRSVGRLTIEFRNLIEESDDDWDYDLYVGDIHLSKRNQRNGYLFPGEGQISHPGAFTELDFPALSGVTKIPHVSTPENPNPAVVFDQYLYETSVSADPLMMAFAAGIYKSNTPAGDIKYEERMVPVTTYTFGTETTSISTGSQQYLIHSESNSKLYMGVNAAGNGLIAKEFASDEELKADPDINNFLWTFESGYKIKSVKNKYVTLGNSSAGLGNSGTNLGVNTSSGALYFSITTSRPTRTYYLAVNSNNSITSLTSMYGWKVRTFKSEDINKPTKTFVGADEKTNPDHFYAIQYINKYGEPVPLTHINRNEHVTITVNVYYHVETGKFSYELVEWSEKNNSTEFN